MSEGQKEMNGDDDAREINRIIENNPFRRSVYDLIPQGVEKILDFGCNQGELLLRLHRDKGCRALYGIEINEGARANLKKHLDGSWIVDLSEEDAELGENYVGFFNYIILHDVLEHLYDPWYVLAKLRKYLAPQAKLILVTPNFQYWGFIDNLIQGEFSYGSGGGLMNEDHIRWFTHSSLIELVMLSGFEATRFRLLFPPGTDFSKLSENKVRTRIEFPPEEVRQEKTPHVVVHLREGNENNYPFFLANKILLVCEPTKAEVLPERIVVGGLAPRRKRFPSRFEFTLGD